MGLATSRQILRRRIVRFARVARFARFRLAAPMPLDLWPVAASALCAGMLMPVAIRIRSFGHDRTGGVRKLHVAPTSRLGGAIVLFAFLAALGLARILGSGPLWAALPLAVAAFPVVVVGLVDDVSRGVRPRYRMLAAVVSALLASAYAGGVVPRVDLPAVDVLLGYAWFALPLTWFMVTGACNAVNLIDGAHGLAAGLALLMFGGVAFAAGATDDMATLAPALTMMGALAGFMVWNYPGGRIFLGDAGAYFIGFMYAELSIQLVSRNDEISAWYVIMLAGYPVVDTLFAMYRRAVVRRQPLMAPDGLHLHTLLFRRVAMPLERRLQRRNGERPAQVADHASQAGFADPASVTLSKIRSRPIDVTVQRANARVAPRLWLHGALCFVLAVVFRNNTLALWLCLIAYASLYVSQYRALVRFGRRTHSSLEDAGVDQHAEAAKSSQ
jgi:UDP-N-acetylmuramyl pentapeptide phosphotransferase/UDP-N-acetylglucosamine-1-phosphate transferase